MDDIKNFFDVEEYALSPEDEFDLHPIFHKIEVGMISDLICRMTEKGATKEELTRATKYSMVVIDAVKRRLNIYRAFKDFDIEELRRKYGYYAK